MDIKEKLPSSRSAESVLGCTQSQIYKHLMRPLLPHITLESFGSFQSMKKYWKMCLTYTCVSYTCMSISMDSPAYFVERYRTRFPGLNTDVLGCCPKTNMRGKITRHWLWTSFWTHPHCQLWGGQPRGALLDPPLKHPRSPASIPFWLNNN